MGGLGQGGRKIDAVKYKVAIAFRKPPLPPRPRPHATPPGLTRRDPGKRKGGPDRAALQIFRTKNLRPDQTWAPEKLVPEGPLVLLSSSFDQSRFTPSRSSIAAAMKMDE